MNRVILNEKIIKNLARPTEREERAEKRKRQAYTTEDVKAILQAIDLSKIKKHKRWFYKKPRAKAIIYFFASTGCRLGAINDLKVKDLSKIENCYAVNFYSYSEKSKYIGFLTPEASQFLDEYLATRKDLTEDSKLFDLSYSAIRKILSRLVKKARVGGVTKITIDTRLPKKLEPREFLDIPAVHGFRSRWNTIMKLNKDINPIMIELIMGHKPKIALDTNYFRPTKENLYLEFKKGIEDLTIF